MLCELIKQDNLLISQSVNHVALSCIPLPVTAESQGITQAIQNQAG
jgi:hypothetical protein